MATVATGRFYFHVPCKAGGVSNGSRHYSHRFNSFPGGISSRSGALASSAVSNGVLKKQRAPSAARVSRERLVTTCALDTGPTPGEDNREPFRLGTTRLNKIIQNGSRNFVNKFNQSRTNFPIKIFLLLFGFYSANALATVLGQTGDWDVLAAGILVALIEGVGYLMYRMPSIIGVRGKELVVFVNYYKSGFSFGLFVDAFKLGS